PHIFVHLEEMPLTSSGKINRNALPETELENIQTGVEYVAPETEKEKALTECIGEILTAEKVSVIDNFFDMGGDSLKAIELTARLEAKGYSVSVKTIFSSKDIKSLAEALTSKETEHIKIEYGNVLPATAAQMRVYTAQMMNQESTLYNIPYLFKVSSIDKVKLQKAVNKLIERHESFRTHFENRNGEIVQVIDEQTELTVEEYESKNIGEFIRPFDMSVSPLFRVGFADDILMIDMHHSIVDGESLPIFYRELNELYMGRELQKNAVQYGEFVLKETDIEESEKYWLSVFEDKVPTLELNTDYPRREKQTFGGSAHYDIIDISLHNRIKEKCAELGITPYVFYMASFNILLSKYSGNEDIVVGTPISGRDGYFLDTVGMFVNTVVLRSKPEGEKRVSDLLQEIKNNSIAAIEHQNYPFGNLVKKLEIEVGSRNPLYDVILAYQSERIADMMFSDEKAQALPVPITTAKNDFSFYILPREDSVVVAIEYCTDLFRQESIEKMADGFKQVLEACLNEKSLIKDIEVMGGAEKQKLLCDFNNTATEYNKDTCVYKLFEDNANKHPERTAVVFKDTALSYAELKEIVENYAAKLTELGIKQKDVVAIHLERSYRLIALQLAVLKIGSVFMPLDKRYPENRIRYACENCNVKMLITDENVKAETIVMSADDFEKVETSKTSETVVNKESCYIIYTSGSTGKPKGCMLTGKGLLNFCVNNNTLETLERTDNCVFACVNAASFDYFIAETLLPLTNGFATVVLDDKESTNQKLFVDCVKKNGINVLMTTPTRLKIYFGDKENTKVLKQLKCICTSGEPLTEDLLTTMYEKSPEAKVYNPIGPSECSVWDMGGELNREDGIDIHIGKPIANAQIYITDKYMNPVPIGVTGEICIAGDGVGAGYINNPELTAEKFIDNPFGEGKLYKTGDLAYWREDGNIVFVGRNDFQVKIRGLRIELGEIENAISGVEGINLSVVTVRKNSEGRQLICAFYTGEEKTSQEIKSVIGEKLPKYMLPHIFVHLEEMPLTSSGKINRNALPETELENIQTGVE
ncbi:MAG: amino acid adenylation domain-containing protein, partial [Clostridia bacterium]|nr:amino acid adenylation domain-containing protein [Clostridia bacterium]